MEFTICVTGIRKQSQAVEFKVSVPMGCDVSVVLLKALELTNLYRKEDQKFGLCLAPDSTQPIALRTAAESLPTVSSFKFVVFQSLKKPPTGHFLHDNRKSYI